MTKNEKNQLYFLCLKMTSDFGNFVAKTDEKLKTKDEMKQTFVTTGIFNIKNKPGIHNYQINSFIQLRVHSISTLT